MQVTGCSWTMPTSAGEQGAIFCASVNSPFQVSHILHKARNFPNYTLPMTEEFKKLMSCQFVLMRTDQMLSDLNSEYLAAG